MIMLLSKAVSIRNLFTTDTKTRNAMGGVPYTKDILAEITNTERYTVGDLDLRSRIRLGKTLTDADGAVIGYIGISVVQNAKPAAYEQHYVFGGVQQTSVSGVFIRRLIILLCERGNGYGAMLLDDARWLANELALPLYCDTKSDNAGMRSFLKREGAKEYALWFTPSHTPMVRYAWC